MDRIILSVREKKELIEAKGGACVYCGCNHLFLLNIDHKNPLCRGGEDEEKNKQVTCMTCNQLKADMTHAEFKQYLKLLNKLSSLNKLKVELFSIPIVLNPYGRINPPLTNGLKKINDKIIKEREKKK